MLLFFTLSFTFSFYGLFFVCTDLPNVGSAAEQSGSGGGLGTVEIVAIAAALSLLIAAVAAAVFYFRSKDSQQYNSQYYASVAPNSNDRNNGKKVEGEGGEQK